MQRLIAGGAALAMTLTVAFAGVAVATEGYCGISWGSTTKTNEHHVSDPITTVRAGHHECFDRFVVEVACAQSPSCAPGYRVSYVPAVHSEGEGRPLALRGDADLQVTVLAPAYDAQGRPTVDAVGDVGVSTSGFPTIKEVEGAGSFEGQTTFGVGVRARLPFRVFTLSGPDKRARLVIDIAHRWS
jgi:hypothetical protein